VVAAVSGAGQPGERSSALTAGLVDVDLDVVLDLVAVVVVCSYALAHGSDYVRV